MPDDLTTLCERLLRHLAGSSTLVSIGELAGALGTDPLEVARAILLLRDRGQLAVTTLDADCFVLVPTAG